MKPVDIMTIEELREEVSWRRAEMAGEPEATAVDRIRAATGLTRREAEIALALTNAGGIGLSMRTLRELFSHSEKVVDVHVCRIREKLGRGMVETVSRRITNARRYVATTPLRSLVDAALREATQQRRTA